MSIWQGINALLTIPTGSSMPPSDKHVYSVDKKTPQPDYSKAGKLLQAVSTTPTPRITRILPRAKDIGPISDLDVNPPVLIELDADVINKAEGVATGTGVVDTEPMIGFTMSPRAKILSARLSDLYEWIFVGVSARSQINFSSQVYRFDKSANPAAIAPAYTEAIENDLKAALCTFFRLYLNDHPVTCWLPVAANIHNERLLHGVMAGADLAHHMFQNNLMSARLFPEGITSCIFDQVEFWNTHSVATVTLSPLIGKGGATVVPNGD